VRVFVALELSARARKALAVWAADVSTSGLRVIGAENLHVTLCFLGWVETAEVDAIGSAVVEIGSGVRIPVLTLTEAALLPPRRPRVLAVGLTDPGGAVATLQAALSERLRAGGWYEPEARPFFAHVTVARARGRERIRVRPAELPSLPQVSVAAPAVTLFRSRLGPRGSSYEPLARVEVG
jgi:2'-5' RNA ligase